MKRRSWIQSVGTSMVAFALGADAQFAEDSDTAARQAWLGELFAVPRASNDPLLLGKFRDTRYFLTAPISWRPNPDQVEKHQPVDVPRGFVTDLASIPGVFYRILPPDAEYAYAAIIHDYLYWMQDRPRGVADDIFRFAMQDFAVSPAKISGIYQAVRKFGQKAWDGNARLRQGGEQRVLKNFPPNARISWDEWRDRPEAFN